MSEDQFFSIRDSSLNGTIEKFRETSAGWKAAVNKTPKNKKNAETLT